MKTKTDKLKSTCFLREEFLKKELKKQLKMVGNWSFIPL